MILYRCRTPTNLLCPCGRVARELRKRGVEVEERRVSRSERDDVVALTGQHRVPLLVNGRDAICDSRRIVEHLRWLDAQPPSTFADGERQRATFVACARPPRR